MAWDDYNQDDEPTTLTMAEVRALVRHAKSGAGVRRDNLKSAVEALIASCRELVGSGPYQALKSVAFTRSRIESDLAYLALAYRTLLDKTAQAAAGATDTVETRIQTNLDANYRNLIKSFEKWNADFVARLDTVPPSGPQDLKIYGRHTDPELDKLIKQYAERATGDSLADIAEGLLARRDALLRELDTVSHQKAALPHEDLMKGLVSVLEGLERIGEGFREFAKTETMRGLIKQVEILLGRFEDLLNKHGCFRMDLDNTAYDLNLVEIVERKHTLRAKHKHVTKVHSHGYIYRGKPIKIAQVEVATGLPSQ